MGRCLHEIIEEIPFDRFPLTQPAKSRGRSGSGGSAHQSYEEWASDEVICAVFEAVMRRHGIDQRWLAKCQRLIYGVLNTTIQLPAMSETLRELPPLCRTRFIIEMEFLFPIPESSHPALDEVQARLAQTPRGARAIQSSLEERLPWRVERGFVKGFIDFIFELDGRVYFADWKSDQLLTYSGSDFRHHIEDHYLLQAQLYTLGVIRWLKISDEASYEARFGGLFYFFLRAFSEPNTRGEGVYFSRPSWAEVCLYERELGALINEHFRALSS